MTRTIIRGGTLVDRTGKHPADVLIEGESIVEIGTNLDATGATELDAVGCFVTPGLVDIHTHLREPGNEEAETIETGTRAAALGGYTAVVAMPNTDPPIDDVSVVRQIQRSAITAASCDVAVAASITIGREGKQLSPMAELAEAGVRIFTDDGSGLQNNRLMRRALEYASMLDVTIAQHCEDESLSAGGHMHEGEFSSVLGIEGIPVEAEELMVMRDIALSRRLATKKTRSRVHLMHLSTAGSIALIAATRAQNLAITAEVTPHHFTLTDKEVESYDPLFKVNPPLRSASHRDAIKQAVRDGLIDAIATDHAPHASNMKELPFDQAPCGMLGLETALALAITELDLPIERVLAMMSWQPARIAQLEATHGGPIAAGRPANLAVIDPDAVWVVDPFKLASKSRNTPYSGRKLRGQVRHTVLHGETVVRDGEATR